MSDDTADAIQDFLQSSMNSLLSGIGDVRDPLRRLHARNADSSAYMAVCGLDEHWPARLDEPAMRTAREAIERTHGTVDLTQRLVGLVGAYTQAHTDLCFAHMRCKDVLLQLHALEGALAAVPYVDTAGRPFADLRAATDAYLEHVKSDVLDVQAAFDMFQKKYVEWLSLRNCILALHPMARGSDGPACTICTLAPVDSVYIPCGHTFCRSCALKHIGLCYVCRTPVEKVQQIFFT